MDLCNIWCLTYDTKAQRTKGKIGKLYIIEIKNFCASKDIILKVKATHREKLFTSLISDKGLVFKMYKELLELSNKPAK